MRSELLDRRTGPIENLSTNPAFARAMAGTTAVRRNLFRNPVPVAYSGISAARLSLTDPGGFARGAVNDTNGTSNAQRIGPMPSTAVNGAVASAFRTYTMSAEVRTERLHEFRFNSLMWDGSAMTSISGGVAVFTGVPAGQWVRVWKTVTAPAGAQRIGFEVGMADTTARVLGETFDIRNILIEERPGLLPFFYGGTVNDGGIAFSWDGPANNSDSLARATVAEVRRNYCTDPNFTNIAGTSRAWDYNATVISMVKDSANRAQIDFTAAITSAPLSILYPSTQFVIPVAAGTVITSQFDIEVPAGYPAVTLRASYYLPVTAQFLEGPNVTISPGERKTVSSTVTIPTNPPGETSARPTLRAAATIPAGARILIYPPPTFEVGFGGTPFSGSMTPDADLTPAWLSTPDGSGSTLNAVRADGTSGNAQTQIAWLWNSNAVRSIPTTASQDTAVRYNGEFNGFQFGMLPGRTYTILMRVRVLAAQTNPAGLARRIVTYYWNGSNHVAATSAAAPNVPGVYDIRYVWTVPAIATQSFVRLYDGGPATDAGKIVFERMAIVEGVYDGPYLDGDMRGCTWRGTAHASRSVGYPLAL